MLQPEIGASVTLITSYYLYVKIRDARNTCNGCKYPQADSVLLVMTREADRDRTVPPVFHWPQHSFLLEHIRWTSLNLSISIYYLQY